MSRPVFSFKLVVLHEPFYVALLRSLSPHSIVICPARKHTCPKVFSLQCPFSQSKAKRKQPLLTRYHVSASGPRSCEQYGCTGTCGCSLLVSGEYYCSSTGYFANCKSDDNCSDFTYCDVNGNCVTNDSGCTVNPARLARSLPWGSRRD